MDSAWLVPAALAFGVLVGAGVAVILVISASRGRTAHEVVNSSVPDGVDQVIEALESAGVVIDPSNNVVKASPGALSYGLVWNGALVHPELVQLVDQVRRNGEPVTEELHLARGPFGEASIYLSVRVARLGARYVLLLAEDRTESYRLDEVRRDFIANISHELKTPIGAVGLLAEALVSASKEPEQVKRFAKRLTKESERLARITQEIIELSRLQATDTLTKTDRVDIDYVVASAIDQNRVAAEANKVHHRQRWGCRGRGLRRRDPAHDRGRQPDLERDPVLAERLAGRRRRLAQGRRCRDRGHRPGRRHSRG